MPWSGLSIHFYLRLLIRLDPLVDSVTSGVDHSNNSKGAQEHIKDACLGVRMSLVMEHGWEDVCQRDTYRTFRRTQHILSTVEDERTTTPYDKTKR